MFDLFRSRQKATRYLMGAFLLMVAASMLTYLAQTGLTTSADNDTVLAEVGPSKITVAETQAIIERGLRSNQLQAGTIDVMLPSFVDQMMQQRAALYVFGNQGLKVTDEEVLGGLMDTYPQYFQNGKLVQRDQLEQQLASNNITLDDAVNAMRDQLMMKKIQNMIYSTIVVTPQEVDATIIKKHQKAKIAYVAFPPAKFRDQVKPTPEELRKFYDGSKSRLCDSGKARIPGHTDRPSEGGAIGDDIGRAVASGVRGIHGQLPDARAREGSPHPLHDPRQAR